MLKNPEKSIEPLFDFFYETTAIALFITTLFQSSDGAIWVGSTTGLHRFDGTTWTQELSGIGMEIAVPIESSDGIIWVGGELIGLHSYDGTTWEKQLIRVEVRALLESNDEAIWAGTANNGLFRYDGTTWRKAEVDISPVNTLLQSSDGTIWAGGSRLYRYDGTMWREVQLSEIMTILPLLESRDGRIWAGTRQKGVRVYNGEEWSALTVLDGLPGNTVDAMLEDRDGKLWFGTRTNGVGVYHPSDNAPVIAITDPKGEVVETGAVSLNIKWTAGDVETETHRLTYQYKIGDGSWTPTGSTSVKLTDLKEGENTFSVRAIDGDLNKSDPAKITIVVNTIQPNVLIDSPVQGAVVGGAVPILGSVTDTDLGEFKVEYAAGEAPSDGDFKLLHQSNLEAELGQLTQWETARLAETKYAIRVHAVDKLGNSQTASVTVTLDNTPPEVTIANPSVDQDKVQITGDISDSHPQKWVIEFAKDIDAADWKQIHLEEDASKPVDYTWSSGEVGGNVTIRLTAFDEANNSASDTTRVQLDNLSPVALATIEELRAVVGGEVTIRIKPEVANLKSYALEWGRGNAPAIWNTLGASDFVAKWNTNTRQTPDDTYTLRMTAFDTADLKWTDRVPIAVDNTDPTALITAPRNRDQVGGIISIKGTAADEASFKEYIIEYGESTSPAVWIPADEDALRTKSVIDGKLFDWNPKEKVGTFTLRLTVKDEVEHLSEDRVTVEVLPPIERRSGGGRTSRDQLAKLYLSPRTLPGDTVITINPIPEAEIAAAPAASDTTILGRAYELGPADLKLTQHKPATLSIRYDGLNLAPAPNKRLVIARFKEHPSPSRGGAGGGVWVPIGGTVNVEEKTVATAVTQLGRYALMEIDALELQDSAAIVDLTCQPRIFSPNGGGFNTETTISFKLAAPTIVHCMIYNRAGELVCRLAEAEPMSGGVNTIRWNGEDKDGRRVPSNMYIVCIQAGDQQAFQTVGVVNR